MTDDVRDGRASLGRRLRRAFEVSGRRGRLLGWALFIVVGWLLLAAVGGRAASVALSGTAPISVKSLIGALYVIGWLAVVLIAPILVLTAAMLGLIEYARRTWPHRFS